jgi:hypothetical protein
MYIDKKPTIREKELAMKRIILSTSFRVILSVSFLFFGILYVANISSMSTKGYDITDLKKQITGLERDNQKLEFHIATYRSMQSIQDRLSGTDLVAADNIEYMTIAGHAMARR